MTSVTDQRWSDSVTQVPSALHFLQCAARDTALTIVYKVSVRVGGILAIFAPLGVCARIGSTVTKS